MCVCVCELIPQNKIDKVMEGLPYDEDPTAVMKGIGTTDSFHTCPCSTVDLDCLLRGRRRRRRRQPNTIRQKPRLRRIRPTSSRVASKVVPADQHKRHHHGVSLQA